MSEPEPISYSGGVVALKPYSIIHAPCWACALASSPEKCQVHNAEKCLGNRPLEASDELLDIWVETVTGADGGAQPQGVGGTGAAAGSAGA